MDLAYVPDMVLDLRVAVEPMFAALLVALAVSAIPLVVTAARVTGPPIEQLLGAATVGTAVEPLAGLALDTLSALSSLRWQLVDRLLAWREALIKALDASV